jgi:hypothetical protein
MGRVELNSRLHVSVSVSVSVNVSVNVNVNVTNTYSISPQCNHTLLTIGILRP